MKNDFEAVCYFDTDSIVTTTPLPPECIHKTDLGKMKLEGIYTEAIFIGAKNYYLHDSTGKCKDEKHMKGVRASNLENLVDEGDLKKMFSDILDSGSIIITNKDTFKRNFS